MKNKIGLLKFKKIIAILCVISSSCLFLSGCHNLRYTEEEANEIVEMGTAVMEEWINKNCPDGKIENIDHFDYGYPRGITKLTDYVKGSMYDGEKHRKFAANIKTGAVWLEADDDMWEEFVECSKEYYLKSLDLPMDTKFDDRFKTYLYYSPVREDASDSWGSDFFGFYGLPGELVLQNGDIKEFVNNPNRGATIYYFNWSDQLPDSIDINSYSVDDLNKRQVKYNVYYDYIVLENGHKQISYSYSSAHQNK